MRLSKTIIAFALGVTAVSVAHIEEAKACGGCFVQQTENTQVTSHRMILSISPEATTLWDQITYSGAPESFAWLLPVKGLADLQLSSDALFEMLDQMTAVQVISPQISCPPPFCGSTGAGGVFGGAPNAGNDAGGVTVVAQKTVGPYDMKQLSASDPEALWAWFLENGYNVPADIEPVIDDYIAEGFDFLALKLVPGQGVDKMRPVRVTTPGASPTLPLRMVAAGTGAVTPISLWIIGEGRYEPTNFPSFEIEAEQLVWNWDTQSSNYRTLRKQGFDDANGRSWLVEASEPLSAYSLRYSLLSLAEYQPQDSGYADENGEGAAKAAEADLDALFSTIPETSVWVSRLYGELSRSALATDLEIGASMSQSIVNRYLQATKTVGTAPTCPPPPDCGGFSGASSGGRAAPGSDPGGVSGTPGSNGSGTKPGSCATDGRVEGPITLAAAAALAALALIRRRRQG